MAVFNNWCAYGYVCEEPHLMKLDNGKIIARTILVVPPINNGDSKTYLPIVAYEKKAHVLCSLVHKGCGIFAKGSIMSNLSLTRIKAKTLVGISFKVTDFVVTNKKPIEIDEQDFVDVVQLYDPSSYMESEEENVK